MRNTAISLPIREIHAYCRTKPIARLSVFGSVLRDDFTAESDVDLLVEFQKGARITYLDMYDMQRALAEVIGRDVDLLTPKAISEYFMDDVQANAKVIYEAG